MPLGSKQVYTTVAHQGIPGSVIGVSNQYRGETTEQCLERLRQVRPNLFRLAEEANATVAWHAPIEGGSTNASDNFVLVQPRGVAEVEEQEAAQERNRV